MRYVLLLFCLVLVAQRAHSQPPSPSTSHADQPPQQVLQSNATQPNSDQRGTEDRPLFVKPILAPKSKEEAAEDKADRENKSAADWWMVRLTGLIALIGLGQGIVFYVQARRLRQTIVKMDEIAIRQTADMGNSIAQATRAAAAMEKVSESLAINAAKIVESVETTQRMADTQREFWQMQMRAYVTVMIGSAVHQDRKATLRFEGKPTLVNTGHTPAHNVRHRINADILPIPLARNIDWTLPPDTETAGTVVAPQQNRLLSGVVQRDFFDGEVADIKAGKGRALVVWGTINYDDVFGVRHFTNFCQFLTWIGVPPDERIMGYYNLDHNDAD